MTVLTIELPGYGAGVASLIVETSKDSALDRLSCEEIDAEIAAARGGCPAIPADWPRHTRIENRRISVRSSVDNRVLTKVELAGD